MTLAIKITVAYLCVSSAWMCGGDWLVSAMFPLNFADIGLYKGWAFLLTSAVFLYVLLFKESTRRDAVERELREQAIYDSLTGLLNRACFIEHLEKAIANAARERRKVGVAFIDLDGFKEINDRFGHQAGDQLLCEVGRRIHRVVRACDSAARLGGDEFVVLVQGDQTGGMRRLAERLSLALREPFCVSGTELSLTASVGLAFYPEHGLQGQQILEAADMAMYRVKAAGKDGILRAPGKPRMEPAAA
ncbi:GGDEF domain-containing protein [Telmatospirillum sp.]|uniref:GGDEF domain-containing protein n=1 Tax=Telmatospirillum sp. TaxID=2079197 RepID=UPI00284AD998|nr:GGDEF domain-containing protein [Telmatospirillum sp.]MDR3437355.1 GGDEF domain-containing protein [Telmatospirillum sp.]